MSFNHMYSDLSPSINKSNFLYMLEILRCLAEGLSNEKHKKLSKLWIKELEMEIPNEKYPSLSQIMVKKLLFDCLRSEILVEPFLKPPIDHNSLDYITSKYTKIDIQHLILKKSIEILEKCQKLQPDKKCLAVFEHIPCFGGHFYVTSEPMKEALTNKSFPMGTMHILPAFCATKLKNTSMDHEQYKLDFN